MKHLKLIIPALLALAVSVLLTACGGPGGGGSTATQSSTISGTAYGGRQPIGGSTVTIYEAGLTPGAGATQIGQATTDPSGSFNIDTFSPVPAAGQIIYVVVQGGDAGGGNNSAIKLMTVAGAFGSAGFPSTVNINELTTVATTAALQHQITLPNCSTLTGNTTLTGTCVAIAGDLSLAKRAVTVRNLVDVVSGQVTAFLSANRYSTSDGGHLEVPPLTLTWQKLNGLADILASCVNSNGGVAEDGSACGKLFQIAQPAADTLAAAFLIASNPAINVQGSALFALLASPPLFTPIPSGAPANWTVSGQQFLYAVSTGRNIIISFAVDYTTGALTPTVNYPFSFTGYFADPEPTSVTVDPNGRFAYVTAEEAGDIESYGIDPATGALTGYGAFLDYGVPSSMAIDPSGRFAYAPDLAAPPTAGLTAFTIDFNGPIGALTPVVDQEYVTTGIGQNAVALDSSGRFAYVVNGSDQTVSAYTINPITGSLYPVDGSPFNVDKNPKSLALDPSGRFAYVANSASDDISAFTINNDGSLSPIDGSPFDNGAGSAPDWVTVSPSGQFAYVVNPGGYNISGYSIDPLSGALSPIAGSPFAAGLGVNALAVESGGRFAYALEIGGIDFRAYSIDPVSGALTPVAGSPFPASALPNSVTVFP